MSNVANSIFSAIENIADRQIEATPKDLTIIASILLPRNMDTGEYKVRYKGGTFSAFSLDTSIVYRKNEEVYVVVPQGNFSAKKIILGLSAFNSNITHAERQALTHQWVQKGPNWLSPQWYWRDSVGQPRTDKQDGGICIIKEGEENKLVHPVANWRDFLFDRYPDNDADVTGEHGSPPLVPQPTLIQKQKTRKANGYPLSQDTLAAIDSEFKRYSKTHNYFMVKGEFITNFSKSHATGEYGLIVECYIKNPKYGKSGYTASEPVNKLLTFKMGFKDFVGQPYGYGQYSPQMAVFKIAEDVILEGLSRVYLYQEKGWETDVIGFLDPTTGLMNYDLANGAKEVVEINNVLVRDVQIHWCDKVDLLETPFHLELATPEGNSVKDGDPIAGGGRGSVSLIPDLYYFDEKITSEETCRFYWFKQKYSATRDKVKIENPLNAPDVYNRTWYDYGGDGWAPIDRILNTPAIDSDFGEFDGVTSLYDYKQKPWKKDLVVKKEAVPWKWRYKVVCVYNPTLKDKKAGELKTEKEIVLSKEIDVYNESSIYDFELPQPFVGADNKTTFVKVRNNTLPWELNKPFNEQKPDYPDPAKSWWCRWWVKINDRHYEPIPVTTFTRFLKGKLNIEDYKNYEKVVLMAQIYGKKNPNGTTKIEKITDSASAGLTIPATAPYEINDGQERNDQEIAGVEIVLLKGDKTEIHVDWDGIWNHMYDASGKIRLDQAKNTDHWIRAILNFAGTGVQEYSIEWLAPDGTVIGNKKPGLAGTYGYTDNHSMMTDMWVTADNVLHYKVRDRYDENLAVPTNNIVTVRITTTADGKRFEFKKVVNFSRPGVSGTQGSDWSISLMPTYDYDVIDKGTIVSPAYSLEISENPVPLIINGNIDGSGSATTVPGAPRLIIRPFVYKNHTPIEKLPGNEKYKYKVYWDTRYPLIGKWQNSELRKKLGKTSFLKLYNFANQAGETVESGVALSASDFVQFTTSNDIAGGKRSYGAIEIKWRELSSILNPDLSGAGVNYKQAGYDFVVRAQVDIFKDEIDSAGNHQNDWVKVASIFCYYPVDILFTNGTDVLAKGFNSNKIRYNWPKEVIYNAAGYEPETIGSELFFYYGEKAWNKTAPMPYSAVPKAAVPNRLNISKEIQKNPLSWKMRPRPYYFYEDMGNGAILTDISSTDADYSRDEWKEIDTNGNIIADYRKKDFAFVSDDGIDINPDFKGWGKAVYVHPVVLVAGAYGNDDINGWDGKGIKIKDDGEDSYLFAPTVGAGYKHPLTNTFSGVVMGIDRSQKKNKYGLLYGGFSDEDIKKNPYMTGLYGYQDGVTSFGIMENGTAYFGRADRGGRIVIDGYNAQIYGGKSGQDSGEVNSDMSHRMRLSFIDFNGIGYQTPEGLQVDKNKIKPGHLYVDPQFRKFFTAAEGGSNDQGFGSGATYATPAIEVGQYEGKGQDLIKQLDIKSLRQGDVEAIKNLEIPGKRRFLVTYDGTLYAMNAFIKGNIVGSNIVGSQFFNEDASFALTKHGNLGIGKQNTEIPFDIIDGSYSQLWSAKIPRIKKKFFSSMLDINAKKDYDDGKFAFFVSSTGKVYCNDIHIGGGSLHIGSFHILGKDESENNRTGDVISFGTMYLVGKKGDSYSQNPPLYSQNALIVWGGSYLRGKIGAVGNVYLGAGIEKKINEGITGIDITEGVNENTSPLLVLSQIPGTETRLKGDYTWYYIEKGVEKQKVFSLKKSKILLGPLRAEIFKEDNNSIGYGWIGRATGYEKENNQGHPYTYEFPSYNSRSSQLQRLYSDKDYSDNVRKGFNELGLPKYRLPRDTFFRIDGYGTWSDGIFLGPASVFEYAEGSPSKPAANEQILEPWAKYLCYFGYGVELAGAENPSGNFLTQLRHFTKGLLISNLSKNQPSIFMDTPLNISFSAGRKNLQRSDFDKVPDYSELERTIFLEAFSKSDLVSSPSTVLAISSGGDMISEIGGKSYGGVFGKGSSVGFFGMNPIYKQELETVLFVNRIGMQDTGGEPKKHPIGMPLGESCFPKIRGQIIQEGGAALWGKSRSIAFDAYRDLTNGVYNDNYVRASLRLARSPSGYSDNFYHEGGTVAVDNNHSVFLIGNHMLFRAMTEQNATKGFISFCDFPPENQFGIYARFG